MSEEHGTENDAGRKPRLLDLFACEGGASVGYTGAGFAVFAVDLDENRIRRNPHASYVGDALEIVKLLDRIDALRTRVTPPAADHPEEA